MNGITLEVAKPIEMKKVFFTETRWEPLMRFVLDSANKARFNLTCFRKLSSTRKCVGVKERKGRCYLLLECQKKELFTWKKTQLLNTILHEF